MPNDDAPKYTATLKMTKARQQAFTDLMQSNVPINPDVYESMPLIYAVSPAFQNGVTVVFLVVKSSQPDDYNILEAPTFSADGQAAGSGIDTGDWEDFSVTGIEFEIDGDLYELTIDVT